MALDVPASPHFSPKAQTNVDDEPPLTGHYLFYRGSGAEVHEELAPPPYVPSVWCPSLCQPWPPGTADSKIKLRFLFRTALHYLRLFANRECGAICLYSGCRLVHYSCFTPRYWRFPFLPDEDIQIGDTWTDPLHRGSGLAGYALAKVLLLARKPGRHFWYVVEAANRPSIHVAERAGFEMVAVGGWKKPLGIKLFGSYVPRIGRDT